MSPSDERKLKGAEVTLKQLTINSYSSNPIVSSKWLPVTDK